MFMLIEEMEMRYRIWREEGWREREGGREERERKGKRERETGEMISLAAREASIQSNEAASIANLFSLSLSPPNPFTFFLNDNYYSYIHFCQFKNESFFFPKNC
uniref:Uncharacterized protein n=1 Tax=Opuntia streptacantha TaxID=393608 RepID=A0A7C9CZU3_OPUST